MKLQHSLFLLSTNLIPLFLVFATGLKGTITSYYPLSTEPGYFETDVQNSFFDGNITHAEKRNLLSIDQDGKLVLPIFEGFQGSTPLEVINHSSGGDFDDPFDSQGKTDQTVGASGITLWHTQAGSLNGGDGKGAAGVVFQETTSYTTLGPGETPSPGVMLIRRKAKIGEVVATRYQQVSESRSSSNGTDMRTVTTTLVDHRSVYVGTDTVSGLFPGSNPLLVTDPYSALVRVSETSSSSSSTTYLIEDGIEIPFGDPGSGGATITSVEWTVKGIGAVRQIFAFGAWLDPIMNNSVFDNGSNVIGTISLEELIPSSDLISEVLRASGGSVNDAADTILAEVNQEIILWPIPEEREVASPPQSVAELLEKAATDAGLSGNDQLPEAMPHQDGVSNILKYAFNMNLASPDSRTVSEDGSSGLPLITLKKDEIEQKLQITYIRRKNTGLTYTPLYSTALEPQSFIPLTGTEKVTPLDGSLERVCIESPITDDPKIHYFGSVKVTY